MSGIKLAMTALAAGLAAPTMEAAPKIIQVPVLGVPIAVVAAALAGAALSLFFGDPITSRRALFGQTFTAAIFGTCIAVLMADGMGWVWAQKNITMFALMSAAMLRWFLPGLIHKIGEVIRDFKLRIPRVGGTDLPKNDFGGDDYSPSCDSGNEPVPPPRPTREGVEP